MIIASTLPAHLDIHLIQIYFTSDLTDGHITETSSAVLGYSVKTGTRNVCVRACVCAHEWVCVFACLSVRRQSHFLKHVRHNPFVAVGKMDEACRQVIERERKTLREREGAHRMSRCDCPRLSSTFKAPLKISKMGLFRSCICLYLETDFGFIYNL